MPINVVEERPVSMCAVIARTQRKSMFKGDSSERRHKKGLKMKFKNVGTALKPVGQRVDDKGSKNPQNLSRYGDKSKRTTKSNLTRGAYGAPKYRFSDEK